MTPTDKLSELGYTLSAPPAPAANYVPVRQSGNLLYVSGQISSLNGQMHGGTLGRDLDVAAGQKAAEICAVNILSQVLAFGVNPEQIGRIIKLTVLVASTPDFTSQHLVANGASDLLVAVLGDEGRHARAAFGVASLPLGAAVEIDAIIEI